MGFKVRKTEFPNGWNARGFLIIKSGRSLNNRVQLHRHMTQNINHLPTLLERLPWR